MDDNHVRAAVHHQNRRFDRGTRVRVTMRDVEDFFSSYGETVEGFDGGWFCGLGFVKTRR